MVTADLRGSALVLAIRAASRRNALSSTVRQQIHEGLDAAERDPRVRAVVVCGEPGIFSSGGDITEDFARVSYGSPDEISHMIGEYFGLFEHIERCEVPVIAAVDGLALGGGLELVVACDLAVASRTSTFAPVEARAVGTPSGWTLLRLSQRMGVKELSKMLMTGTFLDADEALRLGLVNEVVDSDDVLPTALEWVEQIAAGSAVAVAETKAYLRTVSRSHDPEVLRAMVVRAFGTEESRKRIASFIERRRQGAKGDPGGTDAGPSASAATSAVAGSRC